MKLRQNEEKEIDLRTIVDGELNNQINSMLPLDGSKKMTGNLTVEKNISSYVEARSKEYDRSVTIQIDGLNKISSLFNYGNNSNFSQIVLRDENCSVADVVTIGRSVNGVGYGYNIYGEHNPPYIIGNYTGDGKESQTVVFGSLYGFGHCTMITDAGSGKPYTLPLGVGNGFVVAGENNIAGKLYAYISYQRGVQVK